ncbi:MAG: response-associated peptidase [Acidimicrobiales bacterium]|nr:response-associated peptidase [Acidimicrobiales bacterium]
MCGRFVAASPPDEVARYFDATEVTEQVLEPRYNVAPTTDVYAVLEDGGVRRVDALHWGLVPYWAKDPSVGNKMINARAETLAEKGAYKHAFRRRRCIIPADGFYEWKRDPTRKQRQPFYVHRADGEPLALAGLWETWRGADRSDDERLRSCTILTTTPNELLAPIHDRMPVLLPPSAWDQWLDPEVDDLDALGRLLVPAPPDLLVAHPVSTDVNNVRNDDPHLIAPVDPAAPPPADGQGSLM